MRLLSPAVVLLAHPDPDSFNHAVAAEVRRVLGEAGARVVLHDLFREGFDPTLTAAELSALTGPHRTDPAVPTAPTVQTYRDELGTARALAVVHPNWWGQPPAVLTGWLDRVLVDRRADDPGRPRLSRMLVVNTADPRSGERPAPGHDPLDLIWREAVGPVLGDPEIERLVFSPVGRSDGQQRRRWLAGAGRAAAWLAGADR